jgi:hypothetical protein
MMARTDRELDARLARDLFGMKPARMKPSGSISGLVTMWECEDWAVGGVACYPTNEEAINHPHSPLMHYSSTWKGMGLVVEAMRAMGWTFRLIVHPQWDFEAAFSRIGAGPHAGKADTAHRAAALAADKALGGEVDG